MTEKQLDADSNEVTHDDGSFSAGGVQTEGEEHVEEECDEGEESDDEGGAVEGEQALCDIQLARTIRECIFPTEKSQLF